MQLTLGLGQHELNAQFFAQHRDQYACLQIRADRNHRNIEIAQTQRAQLRLVGRVRAHRMRHGIRDLIDALDVAVDGQHLVAHFIQLRGHRYAEAPQADDDKLLHNSILLLPDLRGEFSLTDHDLAFRIHQMVLALAVAARQAEGDGHQTHAADEHDGTHDELPTEIQLRCHADGQADRGKGGDHFIQNVAGIDRFRRRQHQRQRQE